MAINGVGRFNLGIALVCAACSTSSGSSGVPDASSGSDASKEPAARTSVGATGGTVAAGAGAVSGASVAVPEGALSDAVTITVAAGESVAGLPDALEAAGPAVVLGPEGQTFLKPVTVTVPATRAATGMYTRPLNGMVWTPLAGATYDAARSAVVAQTDHFSVFVAVAAGSPHGDGGSPPGRRKITVTAEGVRVIGVFHFAQDPQLLCYAMENAPIPTPSSYILDIDCPGKCEYDLDPSGQVNGCLRAIAPGENTFSGTWSGDCTNRIYPDVAWPEYGIIATNESRDLNCVVRP